MNLPASSRRVLLATARAAIAHGLEHARSPELSLDRFEPRLRQVQSSFVTLRIDRQLRGCVGGLEARQPLVQDVSAHAYMAAFSDARFEPLGRDEFERLELHISVLSASTPIYFDTEAGLLGTLTPGVDGLVISSRGCRATFLPSVWESLPEPEAFVRQLKAKAGIPKNVAVERAWRYTTESIE